MVKNEIKPFMKKDAAELNGKDFSVPTTFILVNAEGLYKTTDQYENVTTDNLTPGQYILRIKKITTDADVAPETGAVSLIWENA